MKQVQNATYLLSCEPQAGAWEKSTYVLIADRKGKTMSDFNPYTHFAPFYTNDFVKAIQHNERWTVSDKNKMPIDIWCLITEQRISGAQCTDGNSLADLDTVIKTLPKAANNTYYLDSLIDNIVVLDIEPTCPDDIKDMLLKLPYLYGEISMSGKGYHLVFPLPDCFSEYPIAQNKTVMKEEHGYYEILLNHYITFTRNAIAPSTKEMDFEAVFRRLASEQKESIRKNEFTLEIDSENIPFRDEIVQMLENQKYKKSLSDFFNDKSKFEYGYIGFLCFKLKQILSITYIKKRHDYNDSEKAWLLYEAAKDVIPYREKHEETRNKLPWLLYLTHEVLAKNTDAEKE